MSIKPVLVPDHDAASLRALMDHFATASTGPTKRQLTESRVAVAAARENISEGFMDTVKQTFNDCVVGYPMGTSEQQFIQGWARAIREETGRDIPLEKLAKLYDDYAKRSPEIMQSHGTTNEGVAEGDPKPVTTGHFADKKGQPKPYPALKNTSTGKVRPHPNDPDQGVAEGVNYTDELRDKMQWLMTTHHMRSGEAEEAAYYDQDPATWKGSPWEDEYTDSAERLAEFAPSDSGDGGGDDDGFDEDTLRKLAAQWFNGDEDPQVERLLAAAGWEIGQDEGYDDEPGVFVVLSGDDDGRSYMSWPAEELRSDVAEARPDVMRHKGDTTIRVVKKGGVPIGEIGIDAEASEGNGPYYVKLYDGSYDAVGFDSAEEALAELKAAISEGITETADVKYGVFAKGGSVGSQRFRDDPLKTFDTKEEATADARRRRSGLSKGERGYYRMGYVVKPIKGVTEDDVEEGWKQKVAGAALAGAAAFGAGGAGAQTTDKYDPAWGTSGYDNHIRSDKSLTRTIGSDPSKDVNDFQKRIQSVTGPNAKGEYKVVVIQGDDIVSHYVTKTPPANWLYKEDVAPQLQPRQTVWAKNTRGHWIEYEVSRVRPDGRVAVMGPGGIDIFPAELLVTQRPAGAVAESIDPVEQLRADIQRFAL
jgi:hypothetical protein